MDALSTASLIAFCSGVILSLTTVAVVPPKAILNAFGFAAASSKLSNPAFLAR